MKTSSFQGEQKWILPNGQHTSFVGTVREGKLSDSGVSVAENGARYEGQYLERLRHGHGVNRWADGVRYEGEFARNSEMCGTSAFCGGGWG